MKQNLLNVSYHIAQYTSIIADLRGEIQRLKCKIDQQAGRGQARGKLDRGDIRHIQGTYMGPWVWKRELVSAAVSRWSYEVLGSGSVSPGSSWLSGLRLVIPL